MTSCLFATYVATYRNTKQTKINIHMIIILRSDNIAYKSIHSKTTIKEMAHRKLT